MSIFDTAHKLHSRGDNWFYFRSDPQSAMESFSITYCHDGTVCMTGDMGCLTWQREYFPKSPDYGFPYEDTGIGYFAEKVRYSDGIQQIRAWDQNLAMRDIDETLQQECLAAKERETLTDIYNYVQHLESGWFGYYQMCDRFNDTHHTIECEEWTEYGMDYSDAFKRRFELLKSVSDIILECVMVRGD